MSSLPLKKNNEAEFTDLPSITTSRNEIDLLVLLDVLWRAKNRIISTALAFAVAALIVTLLLPQNWTSQAVVTPSEATRWRALEESLAQLRALNVEVELKEDALFSFFIQKFNSRSLLENYLRTSPEIIDELSGADIDPLELQRAIVRLSEKMKAVNNDENKKTGEALYTSWTLSFTAPEAKQAQRVLAGYIQYVSDRVVKETLEQIRLKQSVQTRFAKEKLAQEAMKIQHQRDVSINRLAYSLEIAKAAGIIKPVYSNGQAVKDDPDYAITLGADGLAKKLQIEKSLTDPAMISGELRDSQYRVKQLESLKIAEATFQPFRYQLRPSLPIKQDGAGKALIMVMGALTGGLLASGGALLQHALASRKSHPFS